MPGVIVICNSIDYNCSSNSHRDLDKHHAKFFTCSFIYLFSNSGDKMVYYPNHDSELTVALLAGDTVTE